MDSSTPDTPDTRRLTRGRAGRAVTKLPADESPQRIGDLQPAGAEGVLRRGRSQLVFGALGVLLCILLGVAIVTQVRQNDSGDSLETARPADLLVLLDSLQQREAALNTEVDRPAADAGRTAGVGQQRPGGDRERPGPAGGAVDPDRHGSATGPGVTLTIDDAAVGVAPETMLDVINELRNAGAEAMEVQGDGRPESLCPGRR